MCARWLCPLLVAAMACGRGPRTGADQQGGELGEARAHADAGRLDEALQRAQAAPRDADSLYEQGRIWVLKARQAPLPTAPPATGPAARGVPTPPPPEFKDDELRAVDLLEQALAARPDHPRAASALAEVLAPHAVRRHEREEETRRRARAKGPAPTADSGVDWSVDRVLRLFQQGLQADPTSRAVAEAYIGFAVRVDRLEEAEAGYQELARRVKESAEPYVLYGDFLLDRRKDEARAIEQYRQALIWSPADEKTRRKLAGIFLARGIAHYGRQQYALADAQLAEASKYVSEDSDQGARLRDYRERLHRIRR